MDSRDSSNAAAPPQAAKLAQAALPEIRKKIAALQAARLAKARQQADTQAARQREAERKARCARQEGWTKTLTRDADCKER